VRNLFNQTVKYIQRHPENIADILKSLRILLKIYDEHNRLKRKIRK